MCEVKDEFRRFFPCEEHEEELKKWEGIFHSMRLTALPAYALSIRMKRPESQTHYTAGAIGLNTYPTILAPALFGSFHVAFKIEFADGLQWLLKVPATGCGDRFTHVEARALTSEALTMRLLKRQTTIPVPDVYSFSNSSENDLNVPYILMQCIVGLPLGECWFNSKVSKETLEQHRAASLKDVAAAMIQLDQFKFSHAGAPLFDEFDQLAGIGPTKCRDDHAMLKQVFKVDANDYAIYCEKGPYSDPKTYMLCMLNHRSPSTVPFEGDAFDLGVETLLRLFVESVPNPRDLDKPNFVLTHPDLDIQNIIVSSDGHLLSVIDWDGVASVPRYLGNERYPSWLTRDWDPVAYRYHENIASKTREMKEGEGNPHGEGEEEKEEKAEKEEVVAVNEEVEEGKEKEKAEGIVEKEVVEGVIAGEAKVEDGELGEAMKGEGKVEAGKVNEEIEEEGKEEVGKEEVENVEDDEEPINRHENSPEELKRYREMYVDFMAAHKDPSSQKASKNSLTRSSLIIENLKIAADDEVCTYYIVEKIYNEILSVQTGGKITNQKDLPCEGDPKDLFDLTDMLAEGRRDGDTLEWVKAGFLKLFDETF